MRQWENSSYMCKPRDSRSDQEYGRSKYQCHATQAAGQQAKTWPPSQHNKRIKEEWLQEKEKCNPKNKTKKKHCMSRWQPFQSNPLAVWSLFVFFPPAKPRLCHLIFKCSVNWRRAPPRPPAESPGISQRAPTRSTRCSRASACTGGTWGKRTHTGAGLVSSAEFLFMHTHTETLDTVTRWPVFPYFDSYPKTTPKFLLIFLISEQVGMG